MVEKRVSSLEIHQSNLHALCQHLVDQEKWSELKNFMLIHHASKQICQPYYDQRLQKMRELYPVKQNPNDLLKLACLLHDKPLYDLALELGAGDLNYGLIGACQGGHLDLITYLINRGADEWNSGLYGACLGQQSEIVKLMLTKGENLNTGLRYACESGHQSIITLMLDQGANNWEDGLIGACEGGHVEIMLQMLHLGVKVDSFAWNFGLGSACENGNLDFVKRLIKEGEQRGHKFDWNEALYGAYRGGNLGIIQLLINHGAKKWNQGLRGACVGGNLDVIHQVIKLGQRRNYLFDWNQALSAANSSNNPEIIELLLHYGATDLDRAFSYACEEGQFRSAQCLLLHGAHVNQDNLDLVCQTGQMHLIPMLIEYAHEQGILLDWNQALIMSCGAGHWIPTQVAIAQGANDWNGGLEDACRRGHLFMMQKMIELGATDLNRGLIMACREGNLVAVKFLIQHGATNVEKCREILGNLDLSHIVKHLKDTS